MQCEKQICGSSLIINSVAATEAMPVPIGKKKKKDNCGAHGSAWFLSVRYVRRRTAAIPQLHVVCVEVQYLSGNMKSSVLAVISHDV